MRDPNEYDWQAEYWADYLHDFGVEAYVKARYMDPKDQANIVYSATEPCDRCGAVHPC